MRIYGPGALGSLPSPKSGVDKTWKVTSLAMRMSSRPARARSVSKRDGGTEVDRSRTSVCRGGLAQWKELSLEGYRLGLFCYL